VRMRASYVCMRTYVYCYIIYEEEKHIVNSIFLYNLLYCNTMFKIACSFVLYECIFICIF
jgi:hypothetical protein